MTLYGSRRVVQAAQRLADRIALAGLVLAMLAGAALARTPSEIEAFRAQSLTLVNEARREAGRQPLEMGAALAEAAQAHAEDMAARDYYSHVSPEGGTVMDRFLAAGGSDGRLAAENIAKCEGCAGPVDAARIEQLHEGWMNSPEHRKNILADGVSQYGFGLTVGAGGTLYAVETFAGPGTSRGAGGKAAAIDAAQQTALAARLINETRRRQGASPLATDASLVTAARNVIPPGDGNGISLDGLKPLQAALPAGVAGRFQMLAGSCGGCGTEPTESDVRYFVDRWQADDRYRDTLTNPGLDRIGMTIVADGQGAKIAVAVLAGD